MNATATIDSTHPQIVHLAKKQDVVRMRARFTLTPATVANNEAIKFFDVLRDKLVDGRVGTIEYENEINLEGAVATYHLLTRSPDKVRQLVSNIAANDQRVQSGDVQALAYSKRLRLNIAMAGKFQDPKAHNPIPSLTGQLQNLGIDDIRAADWKYEPGGGYWIEFGHDNILTAKRAIESVTGDRSRYETVELRDVTSATVEPPRAVTTDIETRLRDAAAERRKVLAAAVTKAEGLRVQHVAILARIKARKNREAEGVELAAKRLLDGEPIANIVADYENLDRLDYARCVLGAASSVADIAVAEATKNAAPRTAFVVRFTDRAILNKLDDGIAFLAEGGGETVDNQSTCYVTAEAAKFRKVLVQLTEDNDWRRKLSCVEIANV